MYVKAYASEFYAKLNKCPAMGLYPLTKFLKALYVKFAKLLNCEKLSTIINTTTIKRFIVGTSVKADKI